MPKRIAAVAVCDATEVQQQQCSPDPHSGILFMNIENTVVP